MRFGWGRAPANRSDCLFVPVGSAGAHGCSTLWGTSSVRYRITGAVAGTFGWKFERAVERPWAVATPIPIFGTWQLGAWFGVTGNQAMRWTMAQKRSAGVVARLNAGGLSVEKSSDTGWLLHGDKPPTFAMGANGAAGKMAIYIQPFKMVSFGKIPAVVGPVEFRGRFINENLTRWIYGARKVLNNGILRINVNAKVEPAMTFHHTAKVGEPLVTFQGCITGGARGDLLKGVFQSSQLQFGASWSALCSTPQALFYQQPVLELATGCASGKGVCANLRVNSTVNRLP
jgi:hypothetical protein